MSIINVIQSKCTQSAVYWGSPVNNGRGGYTFSIVEEIQVRWKDVLLDLSRERVDVGKDGKEFAPNCVVYSVQLPTGGWDVNGFLYLGDLSSLDSDPIPYDIEKAYEIKKIKTLQRLNNISEKLYVIYL